MMRRATRRAFDWRGPALASFVLFLLLGARGPAAQTLGPAAPAASEGRAAPAGRETGLDEYYRFPLSVGAQYRGLQALSGFATGFALRELGAELRAPLPFLPVLQPLLRAGNTSYLEAGSSGGGKWDHDEWFASLGLGFSTRFSRNFELGLDAEGGLSQTYFQNLAPGGATGSLGWLAGAGVRVGLIPSYNFAVDLRPSLRYSKSLGPLTEFDGLSFGVGFAVSYRFGDDPDAPASVIRALRLLSGKLPPAFAAMQSYYASKPFATVELSNEEGYELKDLEVSFFQPGYMDAPTPVASLPSLPARGKAEVGLLAAFNQEVFKTQGSTPLAGELLVRYRARGRSAEQRFPLSYELYDKNSIIWDDDEKLAAFITPSDSALRNYLAYIRKSCRDAELPGLNEALRVAMATYEALRELNLSYQPDPVTPYAVFRGKDNVVDLVNLPRQTLQRASGDCDDLTALYCALLECAGVETGFITVPGHVYPVFNTKLPLRSAGLVAAEPSLVIPVDGEAWLPVEATLVESSAFDEAWRKGAEEWNALERTPSSRALHRTRSAQASYRAIGLKETDLGLQYGRADAMLAAYKSVQSRYAEALAKRQQALAAASGRKQDYNRLGIFLATLGRAEAAEGAFKKALSMDPAFVSAMVNLGNVALEGGSPKKALGYYLEAQAQIEKKGSASPALADLVLGRLAKTYGALGDATRVESYAKRREAFAASLPGGGSARASEAGRDDGRYLDGEE